MTENEAFIHESLWNQLRMGFWPLEEIRENIKLEIEDNEFEKEISVEWANNQIDKEYAKLVNESLQWRKPTDTDRLIAAFAELCQLNIIALHNAGYTTSDGEYYVVEVEKQLGEQRRISDGYCFYHEQDLARALDLESPSLYIAFQKVDNSDDKVTVQVGQKVVEVLQRHGFHVEWNGRATSKIQIPGFRWQLLYNEENIARLDHDHALKLLLNNNAPSLSHLGEDTSSGFFQRLLGFFKKG